MVKRRTKYVVSCFEENNPFGGSLVLSAITKKGIIKKIESMPLGWHIGRCIYATRLIKKGVRLNLSDFNNDRQLLLKPLIEAKSIRAIWHRWNELVKSIIPDGFQVLTFGTNARMPTALSIRNRLKSLVPTPYNCYLLDRDLRRYLGLELRHD